MVTWATAGFDLLMALQTRIAQSVPQLQAICTRGVLKVRFRVRGGQLDGWGAWYLGMSKKDAACMVTTLGTQARMRTIRNLCRYAENLDDSPLRALLQKGSR